MSEVVVVAENDQGRYQQAVTVGQHQLLADEPGSVGGNDAGLGACTSMTLRRYAERKGLNLLKVTLTHEKIILDGQARDHIQRTITLASELAAEQRQRLLEIANKCPVHRALSQSLVMETSLAE